MTYTATKSKFRSIRSDESGFYISDGYTVAGRAGLEVSTDCPSDYKRMIHYAYEQGWITLVANMYDHEYMWDELSR